MVVLQKFPKGIRMKMIGRGGKFSIVVLITIKII